MYTETFPSKRRWRVAGTVVILIMALYFGGLGIYVTGIALTEHEKGFLAIPGLFYLAVTGLLIWRAQWKPKALDET